MESFQDLLSRLSAIEAELAGTAPDAYVDRLRLREEADALRRRMRETWGEWDDGRSRQELKRELEGLEAHLESIRRQRIDLVKQHGGGGMAGPGADGWGALQLNQKIEASLGAAEIKRRIARLKGLLEDR